MGIFIRFFLIFITLFHFSTTNSQVKSVEIPSEPTVTDYFNDNPMAAMLDSLAASILFKGKNIWADTAALNIYKYEADYIPQFTDSIYKMRIRNMRTVSPFKYVYNNDVQRFIDLYAQRRRQMTSRLLGLGEFYFPLFEEQLAKHNIPLELKYVAVIESALNPKAISRAGAAGLWQFMYRTGKMYGLEVTSYVDDRFDPYKATIAACEHFADLYRIYKDWNLVLAAYNAGSGNVNRAIRRAGGETDYWKIRRFLPRETQSYVPIFIAASYVMMHAAEHNIYPIYPGYLFEKNDTVTIKQKISFDQISEALNIPIDVLAVLNPSFKRNVVPSSEKVQYKLKMPFNKLGEFLAHEEEIYNFKTLEQLKVEEQMIRNPNASFSTDKTHTVKSGESLNLIARRYNVSVNDIQKWNNISGTTIHPGQKLAVGIATPKVETPKPPQNTTIEEYITQPNESLRQIAEKFNCSVDNIRLWNNLKDLTITSGLSLIIHIPVVEETEQREEIESEPSNIQGEFVGDETQTDAKNLNEKPDLKIESKHYSYYIVNEGDTLWLIAQKYEHLSVDDIKRFNNLTSGNIKPGQKLKIPTNQNI